MSEPAPEVISAISHEVNRARRYKGYSAEGAARRIVGAMERDGYTVVATPILEALGQHDPTGTDHMEDAARLAEENDRLMAAIGSREEADLWAEVVAERFPSAAYYLRKIRDAVPHTDDDNGLRRTIQQPGEPVDLHEIFTSPPDPEILDTFQKTMAAVKEMRQKPRRIT